MPFLEIDLCSYNNGDCEDVCAKVAPGVRECRCGDPNALLNLDSRTCVCKEGYTKIINETSNVVCQGMTILTFAPEKPSSTTINSKWGNAILVSVFL